MYEIKPQPLKSFIEDSSIKLPRFQRKKTWSLEKNFLLAVSVFKGYPLGVSIVNIEKSEDKKITKWLLDGRQRRSALIEMYSDPDNIYIWAKKYIKFKSTDTVNEVILKFIEKVNEYIELDNEYTNNTTDDSLIIENEIDLLIPVNSDSIVLKNSGLQLLAKLIRLAHSSKKNTGLTLPFEFSKMFKNIYYVESDGCLSCKKIKSLMKQYKDYCSDNELDYPNKESFIAFYESRYSYIIDLGKKNFLQQLELTWGDINERIELFDDIDKLFLSSSIGLIEISDITTTDSQKIFNIINTGGTILTAAEILSAKPSWNVPINNPSEIVINNTKNLYKRIDITNNGVVRWDLPATLLKRVDDNGIIYGDFNDDKTGFEKEVGLGFKILAGIYQKGVKKEDISKLSTNSNINWESDIDLLVYDLNLLFDIISAYNFFKYLNSWKTNIRTLLSDAIMLNFIILIYQDWVNKGKPVSDINSKKVQKNAFILFDRMVYEYVLKQWRGSSDNKIQKNIDNIFSLQKNGLFNAIDQEKWDKLISDIIDNNSIDNNDIDQQTLTPLIYYFYMLRNCSGPHDIDTTIEVDHIIPKTKFELSSIQNKDIIKDNLFNLGLLPKKENISKSNKLLCEIKDEWLISQIDIFENINKNDYEKFSNINNLDELKKLRGNLYKEAFRDKRMEKINN